MCVYVLVFALGSNSMGQCGTGDRPEVTELCEVPLEVPSVRQVAGH